jgi:sec-independent protein translocase protein TatC
MSEFTQKLGEYAVYLDELRRRVHRIALFFLLFFVIGFFLTVPLFKLAQPYLPIKGVAIVTTSPFQFLNLSMDTGIFIAIILILPVILHQVFSFLKDGLVHREKVLFMLLIPLGLVLFLGGCAYGFSTIYYSFGVIAQINLGLGIENYWDISKFLSQIILTSVLLGVVFLFPIILSLLMRLNVIDATFLKNHRRHAVLILFIITSLLPPTDGVSLLVMVVPLMLLYELTIICNRRRNSVIIN